MKAPYKAVEKTGYWLLVDTRSGLPVSYPTTERNAKRAARHMNNLFREFMK